MRYSRILSLFSMILLAACGGKENEIEVQSIAISQPSAEMEVGEAITLKATVSPSNATFDGMTWTSTHPKVASVTNSGLVSAMTEGNTTITVMAGGKTASCFITVVKGFVAVSFISLDNTSLELEEGDTETLAASVLPEDATDKTVTWTSSNEEVATVTEGVVSALTAGETTIVAQAGDKTALCKVTVKKKFIPVESIELKKTELTLVEGNTETLTATIHPEDATDQAVSWKSADPGIATVDDQGKVTAVKEGETTITATAGEKDATCIVVVQKKVIPVTSLSLNPSSLEIFEGETQALTATVLPENATDKTVTWKSSNPSIAQVEDGIITALAAGETVISASAGDKSATCKVTVKEKPAVSSMTLDESSFSGSISQDCTVNITMKPADAKYDLEWTSSNPRVAEVQGDGLSAKIHTKDFGTATITVKDKISGKSVSMTVKTTVTDFEWKEDTGDTYSGYPLITIDTGEEYQLHYSYKPSSATHLFEDFSNFVFYEPSFAVSTPSVISIDSEGKVTGLKAGTIGIKPTGQIIKSSSGKDRVYITVKEKTVAATEVRLDKTSMTLAVGKAAVLTATILPENATNQTVTWISSNKSVATVNANGTVKAVGGGTATITAKVDGVSAKCLVTVTVPVTSVSLNKTVLTLSKGNSETLTATVYPADATNQSVTWKSSNTAVATVSSSGKVTAVAEGTAQISVTTKDGSKKATCTVTVADKPQESQFTIDSWLLNPDYTVGDQDELNPEDPKAYYNTSAYPYNKNNKGWGAVYGRSSDSYQEFLYRSSLSEHFLEFMLNFEVNPASIYRFEIKNYTRDDVDWDAIFGSYGTKTYNGGPHAYVEFTGTELTNIIQDPALVPYIYLTTDELLLSGYDVLIEVTETNTKLNMSKSGYYFVVFKGLNCLLKLYDVKLGNFLDTNDFVYTHELVEGIYDEYGNKLFEWKNGGWVVTAAAETYGITNSEMLTVEVNSALMYPWDTEESFGGNLYTFMEGYYLYPTPTTAPTDSGITWWSNGLNLQVDKKAKFTIRALWGEAPDWYEDEREVLCEAVGTVVVLSTANSIHPLHTTNGALYTPVTYKDGWFFAK